jgi:hypothetical protein
MTTAATTTALPPPPRTPAIAVACACGMVHTWLDWLCLPLVGLQEERATGTLLLRRVCGGGVVNEDDRDLSEVEQTYRDEGDDVDAEDRAERFREWSEGPR